ncbi:hypothetical protein FZEAL_350 [Fusarium zealandicum]|uniref:Mannan endo-1,4-beta-mannosidase A n=1 Tax=Fusarium zealandicum TaxID=1053134 RepID=A0A8H4UV07_9HYPO|nr:hypothetical protein FZEAL_350 [Fusarium zealandicum]
MTQSTMENKAMHTSSFQLESINHQYRFLPFSSMRMKLIISRLCTLLAVSGCTRSTQAVAPSTSGLSFTIDGIADYFPGTNCYWTSFLTNQADMDQTLDNIASSGLRVLRVLGFNDVNYIPNSGAVWFQHLSAQGSTINTGADGLQVFDRLVRGAEERGLKLIIPLVNYWTDYGGMKAYLAAYGGASQSEWYTNNAAQTQYRKYIKTFINRYKGSDAIFAWELANEPRCPGCNTDVIYVWAASTSSYIKGLDSRHMVALGDEGFGMTAESSSYPYTLYEGTDFAKYLAIDTLDFGTFHMYPSHWGQSYEWGNDWIKSHAKACVAAGKPCFLEEYGAEGSHCALQSPWQKTARETNGIAGDSLWQWGETLSTGQSHDDGFTIYYGDSDWQCLVQGHVASIQAL